jgi:hypothetical protein
VKADVQIDQGMKVPIADREPLVLGTVEQDANGVTLGAPHENQMVFCA